MYDKNIDKMEDGELKMYMLNDVPENSIMWKIILEYCFLYRNNITKEKLELLKSLQQSSDKPY